MNQRIYGFPLSLSQEDFPRGFPTGLSHVHTGWESILGLNVKTVQGKQVPVEWTDTLGDSWNGGKTLEFLSCLLWRAPPLEMRRERREFFPYETGKDPSSRARRRKRGSPGCVRDPRASSRVETGMSGNFLSCSKGVKDPLEVQCLDVISLEKPQRKWASSRLEGKTSWIFSSCGRCSRLTTGRSGAHV